MTSTTASDSATSLTVPTAQEGLLKMDVLGRTRTSLERRRAILDEFDRSGVSAAQFAKLTGIRYSTFAGWLLRRRRSKPGKRSTEAMGRARRQSPLRLVEALIDPVAQRRDVTARGLMVHLPGGV